LLNLPLPNERYDGATVVASTWIRDDAEATLGMVILLGSEPPYYRVVDIRWDGKVWAIDRSETFENIVPTVDHYTDSGGDY
jgi:hypothetical protein